MLFNKIIYDQNKSHILLLVHRLKLKRFEKLNGNKKSFKLMKNILTFIGAL